MISATVTGWLTEDPELRLTVTGRAVTTIRVRSDNRDGGTSSLDVTLWGSAAEAVAEHLGRDRQLTVTGLLEASEWTDADGSVRTIWSLTAHGAEWQRSGDHRPAPFARSSGSI